MCISYGTPENRVLHYKRPNLKFAISTFEIAPEGKKSQDAVRIENDLIARFTMFTSAKSRLEQTNSVSRYGVR